MRAALYALLAIGACRPAEPCPAVEPRPPASVAPPVAQPIEDDSGDVGNACREQVAGLADWLRDVEAAGLPLGLSLLEEGAQLVERGGPPIDEPAPLVHVTKSAAALDGVPVDFASLRSELAQILEVRRAAIPDSPFLQNPTCHLAIDHDVSWGRVVETVDAIGAAGMRRVTFVFADRSRPLPPIPSSPIDGELRRLGKASPIRRQQIIAELLAWVYQDCQPGLKVIAKLSINPVADLKQVVLDELPGAIGACGCAPSSDSVKALHWAVFGNPHPTSGVSGTLLDGTAGDYVSAPAEQPWSEAHQPLAALLTRPEPPAVRLAVTPAKPDPPGRRSQR